MSCTPQPASPLRVAILATLNDAEAGRFDDQSPFILGSLTLVDCEYFQ